MTKKFKTRKVCGNEIDESVNIIQKELRAFKNKEIPVQRFELLLTNQLMRLQGIAENLGVFYIDYD